MTVLSAGCGRCSGFVHSALSSWKPTPGQALPSAARISRVSVAASPASVTPDRPMTRPPGAERALLRPERDRRDREAPQHRREPGGEQHGDRDAGQEQPRGPGPADEEGDPEPAHRSPPNRAGVPVTDPSSREMTWSARSISASSWVATRAV